MYQLNRNTTNHDFEKTNLVTQVSKKGTYDTFKCKNCGMKGKSFTLGTVSIPETYAKENVFNCKKAPAIAIPKQIKIVYCSAINNQFQNLKPDSIHDVITPPEGYINDHTGVWVMGVDEPVKVLSDEFITVPK